MTQGGMLMTFVHVDRNNNLKFLRSAHWSSIERFFLLLGFLHHLCSKIVFHYTPSQEPWQQKGPQTARNELLKVAPRLVRPQLVALQTSAKTAFPWGRRWCNINSVYNSLILHHDTYDKHIFWSSTLCPFISLHFMLITNRAASHDCKRST